MTEAIPPVASTTAVHAVPSPPPAASAADRGGEAAPAATTVEIVRSAHAPVYVYRLLDAASGRPLVQLPFPSEAEAPRPGKTVDRIA